MNHADWNALNDIESFSYCQDSALSAGLPESAWCPGFNPRSLRFHRPPIAHVRRRALFRPRGQTRSDRRVLGLLGCCITFSMILYHFISNSSLPCGLIPRSLTAWCERLLKEQGRSWRRTSFITRSPFSVVISTTRSTSQPAGSKKDRREMKREDTADRVTCAEIRFPFFTARLKMSSWCSCIFMLSQHVQPTTTARSTKSFLVALLALEITSHLRQAALYRALGKTPKLSTQGNKGEKKERGTCHWC